MKTGVYIITNLINKKFYIGSSSVNVKRRLKIHKFNLIKNSHCNIHLQNAWNKYGEENFVFEILEFCEKEDCLNREQYYLDTFLNAQDFINGKSYYFVEKGYNINPVACSRLGSKMSEKDKLKANKFPIGHIPWNKDKNHSKETCELIKNALTGRTIPNEVRDKIGNALRGRKQSKQHLDNLSKNRKFKTRAIIQYDLEGNFIKEWSSIIEAERTLNLSQIVKCCRGNKNYTRVGKFRWKYKEEVEG